MPKRPKFMKISRGEVESVIGLDKFRDISNGWIRKAVDCIAKCVEVDPEKRPSAEELLQHSFLFWYSLYMIGREGGRCMCVSILAKALYSLQSHPEHLICDWDQTYKPEKRHFRFMDGAWYITYNCFYVKEMCSFLSESLQMWSQLFEDFEPQKKGSWRAFCEGKCNILCSFPIWKAYKKLHVILQSPDIGAPNCKVNVKWPGGCSYDFLLEN